MTQVTLQFENNSIKNHFLKIIALMDGVSVVKPQPKTKARKCGLDEALEDDGIAYAFEVLKIVE